MRIIDRYVIRQVLMPFGIGLFVFTFVFIIEALREYVEPLVAKGVSVRVLATVLATLIPQALALSIPMSLLLGLLVAFGRLSGDREFVAMQACGVSLRRLLFPVSLLSLFGWAATSYVMLVAVPASNQTFREVTFSVVAQRAEGEVRPRVFFKDFPGLMFYVRGVPVSGVGWDGVFIADTRSGRSAAVYLARRGGVLIDRPARTVEVVLEDGTQHTPDAEDYQGSRFHEFRLRVDPATVFPSGGPLKGDNEMTIAELRARIAQHEAEGTSTHNQWMAIHRKFAIPVACLVFGVIGLALGATNHRGGALGSFGFGLVVVFAYYIPMYLFPQMTKGGYVPPWLAVWLPNILLGVVAVVLFAWRNRIADQPISIPTPGFIRRLFAGRTGSTRHVSGRSSISRLLDRYVTATFVRMLALSVGAAMAVIYISTFVDLSDKLFKGKAPWFTLVEYFWYATPQFAYYTLPIAVLIATLVTVGMLTRNSELIVMKACGVSLYRTAVPILVFASMVGAALFTLDATILGPANRRAEERKDLMKGAKRLQPLGEPWLIGRDGTMYNIGGYDPQRHRFEQVSIYEFSGNMSTLARRTFAKSGTYVGSEQASDATWQLEDGWTQAFGPDADVKHFEKFASAPRKLEPVSYFAQAPPDARFMSYSELRGHTERLRMTGFDVVEYEVGVARKLAYPFVCLIMTLIAIPFATTMGRSGTMAGIAVGIGLALFYWGTINISAALGAGGLMAPTLAAWAPNLLFGAGAAYLVLTVRT